MHGEADRTAPPPKSKDDRALLQAALTVETIVYAREHHGPLARGFSESGALAWCRCAAAQVNLIKAALEK